MSTLQERIADIKAGYIARAERVEKIYNKTDDTWVEPGIYNVVESDYEGRYDYTQFKVQVKRGINLKDLALKLIEERDYMSSWDYLKIVPANDLGIYSV